MYTLQKKKLDIGKKKITAIKGIINKIKWANWDAKRLENASNSHKHSHSQCLY